ncbi:hypothetical protein O9K51_03189 [Purpureocillium lavendulum]|uniref:Uncharacterized protein n=1 Tax=Purpureocillium lavendulum TaxID=1247861 RepID=A0AB34FZL8_9HYPO|nr:hypothetical protein O9K51_03189 [Purpureocillium lavendulum]
MATLCNSNPHGGAMRPNIKRPSHRTLSRIVFVLVCAISLNYGISNLALCMFAWIQRAKLVNTLRADHPQNKFQQSPIPYLFMIASVSFTCFGTAAGMVTTAMVRGHTAPVGVICRYMFRGFLFCHIIFVITYVAVRSQTSELRGGVVATASNICLCDGFFVLSILASLAFPTSPATDAKKQEGALV